MTRTPAELLTRVRVEAGVAGDEATGTGRRQAAWKTAVTGFVKNWRVEGFHECGTGHETRPSLTWIDFEHNDKAASGFCFFNQAESLVLRKSSR